MSHAFRRVLRAGIVSLAVACSAPSPHPPAAPTGSALQLESDGLREYREGRYAEARQRLEAARRLQYEAGEHELGYANLLQTLAEVERALGQTDRAKTLLLETIAIEEQILPPDDPGIGRSLSNLGLILGAMDSPETETTLRRAIANLEAALGPTGWGDSACLANRISGEPRFRNVDLGRRSRRDLDEGARGCAAHGLVALEQARLDQRRVG